MSPAEYIELKHIDDLLICGICYEYMDTSVMTLCSHNYCSLCIRRYLHYKTQCPVCTEETFEKDLRKNKILDDIITQYLNVKDKLEKTLRKEEIQTVKNANSEDLYFQSNLEQEDKKIDIDTNILNKKSDSPIFKASISTPRKKDYQQNVFSPSTSTEPKIPLMFTPKRGSSSRNKESREMVACPVCKVDVPQNNINRHLDDCLKRENIKDQPKRIETKRKQLPKLVLNLMKDGVLRKKLKELGLPSQGDRKVLESRLQRYIILYNAECDKINPRPIPDLIKQCEDEENYEKKTQKHSNRLQINRNTEHNVIEEQRKQYLVTNKNSFEQLIAQVKSTENSQKLPVKRDILRTENNDISHKEENVIEKGSIKNNDLHPDQDDDFAPIYSNNSYIGDSDSDISCPLQVYSSENPMNFLTLELNSSFNDDLDQCPSTSNHENPDFSCKINPVSLSPIIKPENVKAAEFSSFESILENEEVVSDDYSSGIRNVSQIKNVSKNNMNTKSKESISELIKYESENKKKVKLPTKRSTNEEMTKFSKKKYATYCELDRRQKKSRNNSGHSDQDITDNDTDNQFDYEKSKRKKLHNTKEELVSNDAKCEKENVKLSKNINTSVFRKRKHDILNDTSKSRNRKELDIFSHNKDENFCNSDFHDNILQNEKKSPTERKELRTSCIKNINNPRRKSIRLRSKINREDNNIN